MRKKTFFIFSLLFGSNAVLASDASYFRSGPYVGASVGYSRLNSKGTESVLSVVANTDSSVSNNKSDNSMAADAFVGYRYFFNNGLFTGLDVALSWDANEIQHNFVHKARNNADAFDSDSKLTTKYKVIPGFVFGTKIKDRYLAFIKLGVSIASFKVKEEFRVTNTTAKNSFSFTKRKTGFYGLIGGEYALTDQVSTQASVSYESYGKVSNTVENFSLIADETSTSFKPSSVSVKFGLLYRF